MSRRSSLLGPAFFKSLRKTAFQTISQMCAFHFRLLLRMTHRICFLSHAHFLYHLCRLIWHLIQTEQNRKLCHLSSWHCFHMIFYLPVIHIICTFLNGLIIWVLRSHQHILYQRQDLGNAGHWYGQQNVKNEIECPVGIRHLKTLLLIHGYKF